jgi:hypothetical protein
MFFASLNSLKKGIEPELDSDPDPSNALVKGTDPRIRNWIPNTD